VALVSAAGKVLPDTVVNDDGSFARSSASATGTYRMWAQPHFGQGSSTRTRLVDSRARSRMSMTSGA